MMRFSSMIVIFFILSVGAVVAGDETGNAERGAQIAQPCSACHGMDGSSIIPATPNLAGQHANYLYKQLAEFKSGRRANPVMAGMVAPLSDQDMRDLAAHYASHTRKPASASSIEMATLGQQLYRAGIPDKGVAACAACHAPDGAGIPPLYPQVSGQDAQYTAAQLKAFRSGARSNDSNKMMQMTASRLSEEEIKALAEYISGLR